MTKSLRLFLFVCFLAVGKNIICQTPDAEYLFKGNALDTRGNHASVKAAQLTSDRFGWARNAFQFDGVQSYLEAPNSSLLNSDYVTVSFWVKPTELPAQGEVYLISFGGWQERYKISLPSHGKCIWTTNASSGISDMDAGSGNELKTGIWSHVAFVHDGTNNLIYLNGNLANQKNVAGTLNSTAKPLGIGFDAVDRLNFFNGALDDIQIYGSALTAVQIKALYDAQNTSPAIADNVLADYEFSGNLLDNSSYGNHASIIGGAEFSADRFGFGRKSMTFNSASESGVVASNSAVLNAGKTTISFWVNPKSFVAGGESYILSSGGWQERWKISLPSHGKPVFTTHSDNKCCSDMDSGVPLTLGKWTHVVMVHDSLKDIIYFDGVKVNDKEVIGLLDPTTKPFGIGFDPIDNGGYFDGSIDDVLIYNYALSASDVLELFNDQNQFPGMATDLVAHYKLNGNGNDASQFGNDGIFNGTGVSDRFGWGNNATSFKGADNSGVTADNSSALQSDYTTIAFWINPKEFPASGEVFLFSNGGWQERLKISLPSHGKPVFTTHSNGACCSDMDSGIPLAAGQWTHVAMTHDGAKDIIYFNGVKVNEKNVTGQLDKTSHPLGIGYDPIDKGGYFNGSMDEVMVFNRALTESEIAALYDSQKDAPVASSDLVADYPFTGNANDQTTYANHASGNAQLTKNRFGKANQAYSFTGSTALTASNSIQHNSQNASISFWINPKEFPASGEVYLLSNGGWQERWKISLPGHGKPVFTTHSNGACCSDMDSGTPLAVDKWTHVVMTHDGQKNIIYFDGVQVNDKSVTGPLDPTTKPLGIGYDPIDNGSYFKGSIDDVQIYSKALTAQEVLSLYNSQSTAPAETDTIAPEPPLDLTAVVRFTTVSLNWLPSTDNTGVVAYNVYQDGVLAATVGATSAIFNGLPQLEDFIFGVSAVDAEGNESLITLVNVKTGEEQSPDITPPSKPANLAASTGSNSILFSWSPSIDDRAVEGYVILLDGVFNDSLKSDQTSKLIVGLSPNTDYSLEVFAFDKAGNESEKAELDVKTTGEINSGEPGLVAFYPFDGNAKDATPYQNHGAEGGDVKYINADHPRGGSQAVKFDGSRDSILAPNAVQLISDFTTVAFWIRVDDQNPQDPEAYILDFGHWNQRWKISLPQHLKIVWTTNSKTAQIPNLISDMDSGDGNEMVKGFWWHVVMTHDGVDDKIYVNGELVKSKPAPGKLNPTGRALGMGNNPIEGGQYFNGALDELKIYNKALTGPEAAKLYNSGTVGLNDLSSDILSEYIETVYPVPSAEALNIKHKLDIKHNLLLRVFDLAGKQIDQINFTRQQLTDNLINLRIGNYNSGNYYLNFVVDGQSFGSLPFSKM